MFQPKVLFAYRFNDIDYVSQQASLGGKVSSTSSALLRGFAKKYPDGASVQVYVNPDNPSEAVLEPRANGAWIIWVAVAVIWGLAYFVATRRLDLDHFSRTAISRFDLAARIRASRSAHCFCPAWSPIRSWRISIPVFIRPRISPCTGMV